MKAQKFMAFTPLSKREEYIAENILAAPFAVPRTG
jgi:hypothetical protein